MKEYERLERIGTEPHRAYYIPFAEDDRVGTKFGIVNRATSSRFISLDGTWLIKQHRNVAEAVVSEELTETIPVPACVQMHGYDHIQYINSSFPFPVMLPHMPYDNPCWHYRRSFALAKKAGERYYLNFEGVDCSFYLYVNGEYKGYSQIAHATSEFDITDLVRDGENVLDVMVLKWSVASYLECQDKFRFSGIYRNVYILCRPEAHITDYKIETTVRGKTGKLKFINESKVDIDLTFVGATEGVNLPAVREAAIAVSEGLLTAVTFRDLYTDDEGTAALTLRFSFVSSEKTLSKQELAPVVNSITEKLGELGLNMKA